MNLLAQLRTLMVQCTGRQIVAGEPQCTFCDLVRLLDNVKGFIFDIALLLVGVMVVWGGFKIMFAAGNPAKFQSGLQTIINALIGLAIVLSSYIIVSEVFRLLAPSGGLMPWNTIQC
jgi:hypothetical protein